MGGGSVWAMADNSRLEELRRRAQERIQQVRESMERGEDVAPADPAWDRPRQAEAAPRVERRTEPPPPPSYEATPARQPAEGRSLEGPSLEGPSLEVEPPRGQPRAVQPGAQQTAPPRRREAAPPRQQRSAGPTAHHRGGRSGAASIVSRETLRQAILAQEILGKPVSLRGPRENEDL